MMGTGSFNKEIGLKSFFFYSQKHEFSVRPKYYQNY